METTKKQIICKKFSEIRCLKFLSEDDSRFEAEVDGDSETVIITTTWSAKLAELI